MAQTREGAIKVAARKTGVTVDEYQAKLAAGEKWCSNCQAWHHHSAFKHDKSRWDGLVPSCAESKNQDAKDNYTPRPGPEPGRSFVPARAGDRKQARRRINYYVEAGLIPPPNTLPCTDCGHEWRDGGLRHEYDHYLGYAAEHHEHVEPVCSRCHHSREKARRSQRKVL